MVIIKRYHLTYSPDDVIFPAEPVRFNNRSFELPDLNLPREFGHGYENPVFRKERQGFVFGGQIQLNKNHIPVCEQG